VSLLLQVEETGKPGYVKLLLKAHEGEQQANELIRKAVNKNKNKLFSADLLARKFMGELKRSLQQCQHEARRGAYKGPYKLTDDQLEQMRHIDDRIKLRRHGPAIQMDVMHLSDTLDDWQGTPTKKKKKKRPKPFYSVDMVPTIQISGSDDYFVAKPIKGASKLQMEWRRSFSVKEKERFANLDEDNGCRKQLLRVLKVLRHRDGGLGVLSSYHLKTVIFRMADSARFSDSAKWKSDCLGQRLVDVIRQMENEVVEGVMPHYYIPKINLLDGKKEEAVVNLRNRLKNLRNSQQKMMKMLKCEGELC